MNAANDYAINFFHIKISRYTALAVVLCTFFFFSANQTPASEMIFYDARNGGNCGSCVWIAADGEITENTPNKFLEVLSGRKRALVRINSKGGKLIAAIELGRLFRKYDVVVEVSKTEKYESNLNSERAGECYSACTLAFFGGLYRSTLYPNDTIFGIHRPYYVDNDSIKTELSPNEILQTSQLISGYVFEYIFDMGIDPRIFTRMLKTDPGDIDMLSSQELIDYNIVNTTWKTEPWSISLEGNKPIARTVSRFGNNHEATLEFSCNAYGEGILTLGIKLPEGDFLERNIGKNVEYMLAEEIGISFNDDSRGNFFKAYNRYRIDDYIYAEFGDKILIKSVELERIMFASLHASMVSVRQYDLYSMMQPDFALKNSHQAISLIRNQC